MKSNQHVPELRFISSHFSRLTEFGITIPLQQSQTIITWKIGTVLKTCLNLSIEAVQFQCITSSRAFLPGVYCTKYARVLQ